MGRSLALVVFLLLGLNVQADQHPLLREAFGARSVVELNAVIERLNDAIPAEDDALLRREMELALISSYGNLWKLWECRDWQVELPEPPAEAAALRAREAGVALATAVLQTEKPGSLEWGKVLMRRTGLAKDDAELAVVCEIPENYFWGMPMLAVQLRYMQFEAYCRLHQEEKGLSVACDTVEWLNDPLKLEHAEKNKCRHTVFRDLQMFGQYVAIMASQCNAPLEQRVEALERLTHIENAVVSQAAITLLKRLRERHEKPSVSPTSI